MESTYLGLKEILLIDSKKYRIINTNHEIYKGIIHYVRARRNNGQQNQIDNILYVRIPRLRTQNKYNEMVK